MFTSKKSRIGLKYRSRLALTISNEVTTVKDSFFSSVVFQSVLIYQKRFERSDEAKNLQSSLMIRDSFQGVKLLPLPFFYLESVNFTGSRPSQTVAELLCKHGGFKPAYHDIIPPNNCTIDGCLFADKHLERDKELKYELQAIEKASFSAKNFLLGSTWLPAPIVEFVLEKVVFSNGRHFQDT